MSFREVLAGLDLEKLKTSVYQATEQDVLRVLSKSRCCVDDFTVLISPAAASHLERMAALSQKITRLRFGRVMKLYAPLYVSNECVNACRYCGFNIHNKLARLTLTREEVFREAEAIHLQGFRHVLLVSGEAKSKVTLDYLCDIVSELSCLFAGISIEIYPMDAEAYSALAEVGVTAIAIYQETYERAIYKTLHAGPKADFDYRLAAVERAGQAGLRDLGIGALMGLTDFRVDMTCVALSDETVLEITDFNIFSAHTLCSRGLYTPVSGLGQGTGSDGFCFAHGAARCRSRAFNARAIGIP
jgi:2-iminoacetate synthase